MSDLFDNIKPGHTVHYLTPQGQTRKGRVVMNRGTHLVLNAGGRSGIPQVVTQKNFVKSEDGTRVTSALLSNLAKSLKKEEVVNEVSAPGQEDWIKANKQRFIDQYGKEKGLRVLYAKAWKMAKKNEDVVNESKLPSIYALHATSHEMSDKPMVTGTTFNFQKHFSSVEKAKKFAEAHHGKTLKWKDHGWGHVAKHGNTYKGKTYTIEPIQIHEHIDEVNVEEARLKPKIIVGNRWRNLGADKPQDPLLLRKHAQRLGMSTKKSMKNFPLVKEARLDELDNSTLSSYVTKALAKRKGLESMKDQARRIHTPERAAYFANKADTAIARRTKGIKTALKKIATHLPAEPLKAHSDSESSKHGGWSGMHEATGKFTALRRQFTRNENQNRHTKNAHLLATHFGTEEEKSKAKDALARLEKHGHSMDQDFVYDMHNKYAKKMYEARDSEWTANQQLAGVMRRKPAGHYLVRNERTISGPHKPDEALREYKKMSDSTGVKIIHVKEHDAQEINLHTLIIEAKVEKAAKLAISLKKKAKGNSHVNTEPALKVPDRTNTGTIEGNPQEQENAKV